MKSKSLLALSLVVGGVALCATTGARLAPPMRDQLGLEGAAKLSQAEHSAAHQRYCEALRSAQTPQAELCAEDAPLKLEGLEQLTAWSAQDPHPNDAPLQTLRLAWLGAAQRSLAAQQQLAAAPAVSPEQRLSTWFKESGPLFLVGLVAVFFGSLMRRRQVHALALSDGDAQGGEAVDFGELLQTFHGEVQTICAELGDDPGPAHYRPLIERIEALQLGRVEPLIATRHRLQARYGMGGYAEIFGPLSAAERRLNRSWTALVDQHWPEACDSLREVAVQLGLTQEALQIVLARQS